jgi:putative spermidine/putrescine transport system ATP-binding protein
VVMVDGAIRQVGSQRDLYERPADRFVADFVGRSNFLEGTVGSGTFTSRGGAVIRLGDRAPENGPATFAIRPEQVSLMGLAQAPAKGVNSLTGKIAGTSYLGAAMDVHVVLAGGERIVAQVSNRGGMETPEAGSNVIVSWPETGGLIFGQP